MIPDYLQRLEAERIDISYRKSPYRYDLLDEVMPRLTHQQRTMFLAGMYVQGLNTTDAHNAIAEVLEYLEQKERRIYG